MGLTKQRHSSHITLKRVQKIGCGTIASAVYGSCNHSTVMVLREFRYRHLMNHWLGRQLVRFYYKLGTAAARRIRPKSLFVACIGSVLDLIVDLLNPDRE